MNNTNSDSVSCTPAHIEALCDVVANKKRDDKDFQLLLYFLEHRPKECTPFKGKILQHIQIHALGNPNANLRLLATCFARATLLFRKTPNKSEGPLGAWKSGLTNELRHLEENLDQLYQIAGVNTTNIIGEGTGREDEDMKSQAKLNDTKTDFESIINEHLLRVNWSSNNICALISAQTGFVLPIPVLVLLRLSAKIGLLRWRDYKKKPNGLIKTHVYTLTPHFIGINLMLFRSIISVLGTNVIPFMPSVNQTLIRILEWTRTSNLLRHDENLYHLIRSQLLKMVSFIVEQLSLNINLEPQLLKALLETELVSNLEKLVGVPGGNIMNNSSLRDKHIVASLACLENLIIIYSKFLEASLEGRVKNYVIQTCIKIYRDFESNVMSLVCRRQLLSLLQTIANQPYATSTTEIANHIFELAEKVESDPEMRSLARRALNVGLAHRPTIVTHYDVYNCYNRPMLAMAVESMTTLEGPVEKAMPEAPVEKMAILVEEVSMLETPVEEVAMLETPVEEDAISEEPFEKVTVPAALAEKVISEAPVEKMTNGNGKLEKVSDATDTINEEERVLSYFVDKLA